MFARVRNLSARCKKIGIFLVVLIISLFICIGRPILSFSDNSSSTSTNTPVCNGTLEYVCPSSEYTYDQDVGACISDPVCPGDGVYNSAIGSCAYCPSGTTYDSSSNTCVGNPTGSCMGSYELQYYNGGAVCVGQPECPDNGSIYYDYNAKSNKCMVDAVEVCKTNTENPTQDFCSKRCYDARTDYPKFTYLNSDVSSDISKTFTIDVKKGFSGWGLIRPYSNGCFLKGKFQLCVTGNADTLELSFTFPDGTTKTTSAPLQPKYWNTFAWSINPNLIGLFVRQHGTNKTTFKYVDLVYKPLDNDTVGNSYSFSETFTPMKSDPYEFYYIELQPGTLPVSKTPFCSEQIAMCSYDFASAHAWTEYGRVFFSGAYAKNISLDQLAMSTYYRNNTQEAEFNTGDLFMSTPDHPERGGAYRMWYQLNGSSGGSQTVTPQQGCLDGYTLENNQCVANGVCQTGTYDNVSGKCVSAANISCPDEYTYNSSAQTCIADASCPGGGTLNFSTNQCETYLGESCPGTYNLQGNQCVGSASCPTGTQFENGECVLSATTDCPTGYTYDASLDKCVASPQCPDNTTLDTSTGQCVAQKSCTTTGGTCTAVHGTATRIYYQGYDMSKFQSFSIWNWVGFKRVGDNKVEFCWNGSCGNPIPLYSDFYEVDSGSYLYNPTYGADAYCSGYSSEYLSVRYVLINTGSGTAPAIQAIKKCGGSVEYQDLSGWGDTTYGYIHWKTTEGNYEHIEWEVDKVNDNGFTNYELCLRYGFPANSSNILSYADGTDSCIWAWVPYKCSQTGTVYKTQSQCQSNCSQTVCTCPDGTTQQGDQCIAQPVCPNGGSYDSSLNECVANVNHCPSGYQYDSNNNICYTTPTCEYGTYDNSTNQCVVNATTSCADGYTQQGDKCVANPQCPGSGSYNSTLKECVANVTSSCPSGSTFENGNCYSDPSCPDNGTWDSSAKQCVTGTILTCPSGYTLSGGNCVPSSGSGGNPSDITNMSKFGVTQTNTQDNVTEEFGMYIPLDSMTPENVGFIRKPSDFPSDEKQGYASNRHSDWQPLDIGALNYFFKDTGKDPGKCDTGEVTTDDGCFKDEYPLCPDGQVELYPDYKGQCFKYIEQAACWDGQTQFGNECYIKLSNTPNVCPSDGRNYTLETPPTADYICKTTTQPSCPAGDIRDGNVCYKTTEPTCPSGYTRQGGTCVKTAPANCPSGTQNIGGTCYYTAQPQCPSGYILTGNRQCSKDEWISGEVDDCYDANWNIIQYGQRLQCPSGYNKVTGLGRWYPVNGQAVGTCSSVSGTQNTAVGTHYAVCHATADATCPSGYSFNSNYQVTSTFTETGHSHDYYKKDGSLILFGQYRWDYNESSPNCGSIYNHTFTCYDSASVYGGFVDSTIENENAGKICFNTSNRDCTITSDGCVKYEGPACPNGYSWDGQECKQTVSACPNGSYDTNNDKCITYDRQACDISPYDWTYDSSSDMCVHTAPAQCNPGERKKADNETWSACYQLDTSHGQPPGHIYCRNNLTYWDYGNREGCYQKEGVACDGHYQEEPNPDVIIGSGNQYNEWTGQCWVKTKDLCGENELYGRGVYQPQGVYHCLKRNMEFDYITDGQVNADTLSQYLCEYEIHAGLGLPSNDRCYHSTIDNSTDSWWDYNNPHQPQDNDYRMVCPIDKNERCNWLGGNMWACGTNKKCAYCYKNIEKNDYYGDIRRVVEYNGKWFGLSYNKHSFNEANEMAQVMGGRLPQESEASEVNTAFKMSIDCWYNNQSNDTSEEYRYLVVVWSSDSNMGFFAPCKFDDNGDMICTADMTECVNGHCPYGDQYPCQPIDGKEYCSRYDNTCLNMANPNNAPQVSDTPEGQNDKKKDGKVTENGCEGTVYIFNGQDMRCRTAGVETGGTNCCKKRKDWFGLGRCKPGEIMLAQKVAAGLCHEVGTYCALKFGPICLQKKKTYCCFGSVLGRIVQEQARETQGLPVRGWGEPKDPICWGFKPDQFQALDWDKIDLSEYYNYIKSKLIPTAQQKIQKATQSVEQKYEKEIETYTP